MQWEGREAESDGMLPGGYPPQRGRLACLPLQELAVAHSGMSFLFFSQREVVKQFCTDISASGTESGALYYQLEVECKSSFCKY